MSSLERVGKQWRVRWREGGRGSPLKSSPRYETKSEAEEFQIQLAARIKALRAPDGMPMTGRELAEQWRLHLLKHGRTQRYIDIAYDRLVSSIGDAPLSRLSRDTLRSMKLGRRRVIQAALRWGRNELGVAIPDACLRLPISSPPRTVRPDLMPDDVLAEIQVAADRLSPHMGTIVHLVGHYGHRPESLSKLRPEHIEAEPPRITLIVKGGDTIRHPIAAETLQRLQSSPPPFLDPRTGKPFPNGYEISVVYRSALGRSRWKAEPGIYALKRRAISTMLLTLDPATIASITGHRRPDVLVRHYARTNEARQVAALAAIFPSAGYTGVPRDKASPERNLEQPKVGTPRVHQTKKGERRRNDQVQKSREKQADAIQRRQVK